MRGEAVRRSKASASGSSTVMHTTVPSEPRDATTSCLRPTRHNEHQLRLARVERRSQVRCNSIAHCVMRTSAAPAASRAAARLEREERGSPAKPACRERDESRSQRARRDDQGREEDEPSSSSSRRSSLSIGGESCGATPVRPTPVARNRRPPPSMRRVASAAGGRAPSTPSATSAGATPAQPTSSDAAHAAHCAVSRVPRRRRRAALRGRRSDRRDRRMG